MPATAAVSNPAIPVGEYLGSVYRPDVDYVDGVLEERNVGEFDHGDLQWAVLTAINAYTETLGIRARPEIRVQIGPTRFRVPDVCVVGSEWKREPIVRSAPLLCVEILSTRDTLRRMRSRCGDYLSMGVSEAWILDARTRTAYVLTVDGMTEITDGVLRVPGVPVELDTKAIFSILDTQ